MLLYFYFFNNILLSILTLLPLLISIAFFTLAERKVMASIQRRKGPNVVGIFGLLQPFADGFKLILKENIFPTKSNIFLFLVSPILILTLSFISWVIYPFNSYSILADIQFSILYSLLISSLGIYGIFLAGWSSNSKYSLLGAIRAISQMISYEISISIIILPIILLSGSFNLITIIYKQTNVWYILPLLPLSFIFLISILAETNRAPFDLAEAEAELVAGYNIEYSAILFVAFFLAEYSNILLMSGLFVIFFLGGWSFIILDILSPFFLSIKIVFISFMFIFIRSNLPRYRYDQLMFIGWKIFLPLTFGFFIFYTGVLWAFNFGTILELPFINLAFIFIQNFKVI
jgi:NADH-quinone oxidoreductase subunit H